MHAHAHPHACTCTQTCTHRHTLCALVRATGTNCQRRLLHASVQPDGPEPTFLYVSLAGKKHPQISFTMSLPVSKYYFAKLAREWQVNLTTEVRQRLAFYSYKINVATNRTLYHQPTFSIKQASVLRHAQYANTETQQNQNTQIRYRNAIVIYSLFIPMASNIPVFSIHTARLDEVWSVYKVHALKCLCQSNLSMVRWIPWLQAPFLWDHTLFEAHSSCLSPSSQYIHSILWIRPWINYWCQALFGIFSYQLSSIIWPLVSLFRFTKGLNWTNLIDKVAKLVWIVIW